MKKIFIFAGVLSLLLFSSCNDFLNEELQGQYTSQNIFDDVESADYALTGAYNSLSFTTSSNFIWVFGDVASDDAVKGGSISDQADIGLIDDFNVRSDNGIMLTYWTFAYEGVNRANNIISGRFGSGVTEEQKAQYIAQAKFIRAYYFFNLVNIWGKIPLRLEPTTPNNLNLKLSEVSDVYARIETDLNEAAEVLPASYSDAGDKGKATKGAAYGLLAKAQLYQKKYDDCIKTITEEIEPLGIYDLENDYADLFKLGAESSKEALFAVRHQTGKNPGVGNSLNQWFAPLTENGYYFDAPTENFVQAFGEKTVDGETDPRLDASIGRPGQPWLNDNVFEASWSPTGYLVKKYNQPLDQVEAGIKGDGGLAYMYMRYADIILMKAESYAELDQLDDAAIEVNKVRDRVNLPTIRPINKDQMVDVIRLERRREFGFEFHRFFDLMRWGKEAATTALGPSFIWAEPRYYFPIPQNEKDSNNAI